MEETKLREIWGDDLFEYCYQKSIEYRGYPEYLTMALVAIGVLNQKGIKVAL